MFAYLLAWALMPAEGESRVTAAARARQPRLVERGDRHRAADARGAAAVPRVGPVDRRRARVAGRARRRRRRADLAPVGAAPPTPRRRASAPSAGARAAARSGARRSGVALVVGAALLFLYFNDALRARARRAAAGRRRARGGHADPRAVVDPARARARRRARRAHALAGARRARRAPARLRAADARADAAPGRQPARGRRRSRAARSASCARGSTAAGRSASARRWRPRSSSPPPRRRRRTACRSTSWRSATPARRRRRGARRRRARGDRQRREVRRRRARCPVFAEVGERRASRCSCATAAPASTPTRCPPTAAACASRSSGACGATAATPASTPRPGERHRGRADAGARAMSAQQPSVVIVDDHQLFRAGVRAELDGLVEVLGDAATVEDAVRCVVELEPDVVLLDVQMPGGGGVQVIRDVAQRRPAQRFLALSVSDAAEDVIAIIRAGARGYVTKTISGPELADAVRRVAGGDAVFSPRLAGFVLDAFAGGASGAGARGDRRRARPADRARARGPPAHRPRLPLQGDRGEAPYLRENRRGARLGGAAQAAAVQPPRAQPLGRGAPPRRLVAGRTSGQFGRTL